MKIVHWSDEISEDRVLTRICLGALQVCCHFHYCKLYFDESASGNLLFLLLVTAPQLVIAAGFLSLFRDESRYSPSIPLLSIGKFLNLFPEIALVIFNGGILSFIGTLFPDFGSFLFEGYNQTFFLFCIICIVDLIFFVFLLSYKKSKTNRRPENGGYSDFPIVDSVRIEEEE